MRDVPFPAPLHAVSPVEQAFAVAVLLTARGLPSSLMRWDVDLERGQVPSAMPDFVPPSLRDNPTARCTPLWAALARRSAETVRLSYLDEACVAVKCRP